MLSLLTRKISFKNLNLVLNINPSLNKSLFINLFFFFSLMPYVSPVPLGSDVQIVTGMIGYLMLLILILKDRFLLDKRELLIFGLGFFFIFYVNINEDTYQFRKAIGPIYGFSIYYIAKHFNKSFNIKILNWVIFIYIIGAIIQYISTEIFSLTLEKFIRMAKYSGNSGRGITSLTPEPSFLGTICVYILIIQDWYYKKKIRDRNYYIRFFLCVILILMSKSGGGYILLFLFILYKSFNFFKKYWHISAFSLIISVTVLVNTNEISGNKGLSDLVSILKSTSPKQLLRVSSLANRLNPVLVGTVGALEKPFGRGSGAFTTQAQQVYAENQFQNFYPKNTRDKLLAEISEDSVSTFGKYIFEYGIFFLLYLILVISGLNFKETGLFILFLVLTGLLFSLPIVYPPIWIVLGFYDKKGLVYIKKNYD